VKLEWSTKKACCIVLTSQGYPDKYQIHKEIKGLDIASKLPNVHIFHAGTTVENGKIVTNGGRVINVVGLGDTLEESRNTALNAVKKIDFEGMFYRKDIGH
jgi:phosphoribosylamine--glycine ligase